MISTANGTTQSRVIPANMILLYYDSPLAKTGLDEYEKFQDGLFMNWNMYLRNIGNFQDFTKKLKNIENFSYPTETVRQSFNGTLKEYLILFITGILFFVMAFVVFLRKDVR
jgi:ABC-type transport system involved in multi-copper enzyme maturation permease subunit